jgi:hypothetical protein
MGATSLVKVTGAGCCAAADEAEAKTTSAATVIVRILRTSA